MAQTTIAIVADCDDTLAPDTTGQLLDSYGIDKNDFFQNKAASLVKQGWDPSLAYMHEMVELAQGGGPLSGLSQTKLQDLASQLQFFPGVPKCFDQIKQAIEGEPTFRAAGIRVESYVVSGGIAELLRASQLKDSTHYIWGCDFAYDPRGVIAFPKNVISFTEKTRFLYMINKGKVGPASEGHPYAVNEPMTDDERPVPFENMVYIGDGPSDIPCMSLIQANRGFVIGVTSEDNPAKTWALAFGRRANQTVECDFTEDGSAYKALHEAVWQRALSIIGPTSGPRPVPRH